MNGEGSDFIVHNLPRLPAADGLPGAAISRSGASSIAEVATLSWPTTTFSASDFFLASVQPYVVRGLHERWIKPVLDRVLALVLLLVAVPVMVVTAAALHSQIGTGGVLIRQQRVGLNGRPFAMLKLRTMRADRRRGHHPYEGPDRRRSHKTLADPRHTPRGRAVRRLSIDELPQLWNVLRGEMSLVGPRPELLEVIERNGLVDHARHRVKPGLTGPWQVSADRNLPLHEHLDRDLAYLLHITLWGDLVFLARTVGAVVRRQGS
jgi:lipopolysaccharide/colanic/teichoic acid biosynthesis glycosyltransferase